MSFGSSPTQGAAASRAAGGGFSPLRLAIDAVLAIGLAGVLLVVYGVDLATSHLFHAPEDSRGSAPIVVEETEREESGNEEETREVRLRLAVTPADFDDMGRLLRELGEGYAYDNLALDELLDADKLKQYDVIFATCGGAPDSWLGEAVGAGERNSRVYIIKPEVGEKLRSALRGFVQNGGTLYASDWRYQIVSIAFPELVSASKIAQGDRQEVQAEVVDDGLREVVGEKIPLNFDQEGWYPAAFRSSDAKVYVRGAYQALRAGQEESPLLVRVPFGQGSIIFTSFHNEAVNSEIETKLLKYLVFTTVTAKVQTKVRETLFKSRFTADKENLLSTSAENPKITSVYQNKTAGDLKFVLAFEQQGARLKLEVFSPDGKLVASKEGTSTVQIDVPAAAPGEWKYVVTALKLPFPNYPFNLTVGRKQ
ncbi:MAG: hypothetical protein U0935_16595 [Pirellulales bacterium]